MSCNTFPKQKTPSHIAFFAPHVIRTTIMHATQCRRKYGPANGRWMDRDPLRLQIAYKGLLAGLMNDQESLN